MNITIKNKSLYESMFSSSKGSLRVLRDDIPFNIIQMAVENTLAVHLVCKKLEHELLINSEIIKNMNLIDRMTSPLLEQVRQTAQELYLNEEIKAHENFFLEKISEMPNFSEILEIKELGIKGEFDGFYDMENFIENVETFQKNNEKEIKEIKKHIRVSRNTTKELEDDISVA